LNNDGIDVWQNRSWLDLDGGGVAQLALELDQNGLTELFRSQYGLRGKPGN
jgi:hypothetical protein